MGRIWQTQTILHDPDNGDVGNCMQAAIASVLGLTMCEVPHFAAIGDADDSDDNRWWFALSQWAFDRGLVLCVMDPDDLPEDAFCILNGRSPRGVMHSVVGRGRKTIHDPHPSRAGIESVEQAWVFCEYPTIDLEKP